MNYKGDERRRHIRIPLSARVTVIDGGLTTYMFTKDLSLGGAGLISDAPFEVGTKMMLEFGIHGVTKLVKAKGLVVRHFWTPKKGFGVKFTRFMPHSRALLNKALDKMERT